MFLATAAMGSKAPSVAFQYSNVINANATVFTFAGVPIGTAGRRYVVFRLATLGTLITSVTVNGVASTLLGAPTSKMYISSVPTGTTCTIQITQSSAFPSTYTIMVWSVWDIRSATAYDYVESATASPVTVSVNVPNRGIVIATALPDVNGASVTWTAGVVSDYSQTSAVNNIPRAGASEVAAATGTPRVVTCTYSASAVGRLAQAVSLR